MAFGGMIKHWVEVEKKNIRFEKKYSKHFKRYTLTNKSGNMKQKKTLPASVAKAFISQSCSRFVPMIRIFATF